MYKEKVVMIHVRLDMKMKNDRRWGVIGKSHRHMHTNAVSEPTKELRGEARDGAERKAER